jgi:hypothetical protein
MKRNFRAAAPRHSFSFAQSLLLAATISLQGCGGGGGGDDNGGGNQNPPPPAVVAPSALSYTSPQNLTLGTAMTALSPTVTGTVTGYAVDPALPAGLSIDATTGQISGTPTAMSAQANYTITASNSGGSTTFALPIAVSFGRVTTDRTDEVTGPQVHVLYVIPSDGTDAQLDTAGKIEGSVRSWNKWLAGQTGGPQMRIDTYAGGHVDVSFLKLARTAAEMNAGGGSTHNEIDYSVLANGFDNPDKIYLVYYAGAGDACGGGAWPPALHSQVGALFLLSPSCPQTPLAGENDPPAYWDFLGAHEVMHELGLVAPCAPHVTGNGHVSDSPQDLMYSGGQAWKPSTLDVNHDDYYAHSNAGCIDLAMSVFLEPALPGAVKPPGWPYQNLQKEDCSTESTVVPAPTATDSQTTFVNAYAPSGTPASVDISELVLNGGTGLYVRQKRVTIPYLQGAVVAVKSGAVYVASATTGGTCLGVVHTTDAPSRFVVK